MCGGDPVGIPLHRCPGATVDRECLEVCRMVSLAEVGILPLAGGWRDQPATFADAFWILLTEKREHEREASERHARAKGS